jgi:hypothetical protein
MNAFVLIPFALILFFLRDYLLLQMGPVRLLSARLRLYALVVFASILLVSGTTFRLSDEKFFNLFQTPRVVLPIVGFYALFVTICLWIRRSGRHHRAWLLAMAPNPLLAFCVALLPRLVFSSSSMYSITAGSVLAACVWIGLISLCLRGTVEVRMDASDLDFSIGIAAWVNAIALLLCQPTF